MDFASMVETISGLKTGDRVELVFVESDFGGDLKGLLLFIISMCTPVGTALDLGEMSYYTLRSVAQSGKWHGYTKYTATILEGFDASYFASRTVYKGLLKSISKVE